MFKQIETRWEEIHPWHLYSVASFGSIFSFFETISLFVLPLKFGIDDSHTDFSSFKNTFFTPSTRSV